MLYANCSSGLACIVFVRSSEGEKESELPAGESVTVTGITEPIEVGGGAEEVEFIRGIMAA